MAYLENLLTTLRTLYDETEQVMLQAEDIDNNQLAAAASEDLDILEHSIVRLQNLQEILTVKNRFYLDANNEAMQQLFEGE